MNEELEELLAELEEVKESEDEYLPNYGYDKKEEVIDMLEDEISRVREAMNVDEYDYEGDELEQERRNLCLSLGIARFC